MAKVYYQDEQVTIYHGDCLEITEWLEADVMITDPPYGMAFVSSWTTKARPILNDHDTSVRDAVLALWGAKPGAVFGTWKAPRPEGIANLLIWDKTDGTGAGMGDLGSCWGFSHEEIYIFGRWPKGQGRSGSVIRTKAGLSNLASRSGHPTPKPPEIMEKLLRNAPPGTIADPFMGSGSTLVAAKALGRRAIGIEIEEKYCEIAAERCQQNYLFH
jgi:site-specific DNA-methyltransferase (adenine-specific)